MKLISKMKTGDIIMRMSEVVKLVFETFLNGSAAVVEPAGNWLDQRFSTDREVFYFFGSSEQSTGSKLGV